MLFLCTDADALSQFLFWIFLQCGHKVWGPFFSFPVSMPFFMDVNALVYFLYFLQCATSQIATMPVFFFCDRGIFASLWQFFVWFFILVVVVDCSCWCHALASTQCVLGIFCNQPDGQCIFWVSLAAVNLELSSCSIQVSHSLTIVLSLCRIFQGQLPIQ